MKKMRKVLDKNYWNKKDENIGTIIIKYNSGNK